MKSDCAAAVLDLAAVGIVNSAWRNSPAEDWHAQGRLDDGDMLRINAHNTWPFVRSSEGGGWAAT